MLDVLAKRLRAAPDESVRAYHRRLCDQVAQHYLRGEYFDHRDIVRSLLLYVEERGMRETLERLLVLDA